MKKYFAVLLVFFAAIFAFAQKNQKAPDEKIVKVTSSQINWWGYKVVKSQATTHTGTVNLRKGYFIFHKGKFDGGEFLIDMRSLTSTDQSGEDLVKLNNDLKSSNFFDVKANPIATFQLTKVLPSNSSEYNSIIYGNFTLKGIRKTISFPANVTISGYNVSIESSKFTLNRQDYGVFYRSSLRDYIIKDEMDIQFRVASNVPAK